MLGCSRVPIPSPATATASVAAHYGQVPLSFEANHGQANEPVQYLARGTNATLYLMPTEAALEVRNAERGTRNEETDHQPPATAIVKMKLLGANANPRLQGQQELPGKSNYFSGNDPQAWQTNIPTYQKVKYEEAYEGIDLVYYGNQQQLEYDFIVQPGADPKAIQFRLEGAEQLTLNSQGELVLQTEAGEIKQHKPVIYQEVNGNKEEVAGNYVVQDGEVSFMVSDYDVTKPLVIDPIISWASYVGGQSSATASAITTDKSGNVYLVVWDGPNPTAGAYSGGSGYSVMKVNASGTAVLWTARIGASSLDRATGIALDKDNNVYLTGGAVSSQYPTTLGAYQTAFGITCSGCRKAFVTKLSADGSQLSYSTFVGGTQGYQSNAGTSAGGAIAVDGLGQAYITGSTSYTDFPTTLGVLQPQLKTHPRVSTPDDAFVTKLNATGTGLLYSTYLGAESNADEGKAITIDTQGNAYIAGFTFNGFVNTGEPRVGAFPITSGAYVTTDTYGAGVIFLTKINPSGTTTAYSALIGTFGVSVDRVGLAVDGNGSAYIAGGTRSRTFPTTPGAYRTSSDLTPDDSYEAFVTKVNPTGTSLVYSTFVGGSRPEYATGLVVDSQGQATIVGLTGSPDFPQTDNPQQVNHGVGFLTQINASGNKMLYSTLHTGGTFDGVTNIGNGSYYVFGGVRDEFTPTSNAFQTAFSPYFMAKLMMPQPATTVSAANYSGSPLASEAIVSTFGTGLATTSQNANALPLPTTLGGTTVKVRDSGGTERNASLFFASPTQVNFQLPAGTANGNATITITAQDGASFVSLVEIANVVPSLFSADTTGRGIAAAQVQRAGSAALEPMVTFDVTKGQFVAVPIELGGVNEQVYLVLYGTGIRLRSSLSNVTATMGGVAAPVTYAGAQGGFVGLDQVNILIPRSLIGRGLVDAVLTVDGKTANTVKASIK